MRAARALPIESKPRKLKHKIIFIFAPIYQLQEISRTMKLFAIPRVGAKFLPILIFLSFFSASYASAQERFTRGQFSRLSVLERAAFFERTILQASQNEGVDPNLLWTIAYNETRFRPWLRSPKDARGMMQFIPSTAARFDLSDPYEPTQAIAAAARYVKYLSKIFGGRVDSILAAYNAGEGAVSAFRDGRIVQAGRKTINAAGRKSIGGVPPYAETIGYVGRGLKIYRWLVNRRAFPSATFPATFPTEISASVARVALFDPELGSTPNFVVKTDIVRFASGKLPPQKPMPVVEPTSQAVGETGNQSSDSGRLEIYYDARSGNRYSVGKNGDKIKLAEAGQIVITNNRQETNGAARSSFFGANKPK